LASGGGVMSVRTRPRMPTWSTVLESTASTARISGTRRVTMGGGALVYWKKIES
jgi:hypothetical protein